MKPEYLTDLHEMGALKSRISELEGERLELINKNNLLKPEVSKRVVKLEKMNKALRKTVLDLKTREESHLSHLHCMNNAICMIALKRDGLLDLTDGQIADRCFLKQHRIWVLRREMNHGDKK